MSEQSSLIHVTIQREPDADDLPLPAYATPGAAGMDLYAAVSEPVTLAPGERRLVSTGIRIALPNGFEAQIRPRSGRALREGLTLANAPGTIDSDYRGVIQIIVVNLGQNSICIRRGERVAQMIVAPVLRVLWQEEAALTATARQDGGFGHTGGGAKGDGNVADARA